MTDKYIVIIEGGGTSEEFKGSSKDIENLASVPNASIKIYKLWKTLEETD